MSHSDESSSFLWFLAGLGIGAALGVLYAPRSGQETRDVIMSKAQEGRNLVIDRAQKAREQAEKWVDKGRDVLQQQKDQLKTAYEAGRQAFREAATEEAGKAKNL